MVSGPGATWTWSNHPVYPKLKESAALCTLHNSFSSELKSIVRAGWAEALSHRLSMSSRG